MVKNKFARLIYFSQGDLKILNRLAQQRNESKSAVVRKLIHVEKYAQTLKEIEILIQNHNEKIDIILKDFMQEIIQEYKYIGRNLNQIAYHLNLKILNETEAQTELEREIKDFKKIHKKIQVGINKLKINIDVKHTKTPKKEETQDE